MTSKARLFYPKELKSGLISNLSESQSHYIKNVMRLNIGDSFNIFNENDVNKLVNRLLYNHSELGY